MLDFQNKMVVHETVDEDDQDSLFGSPPPSPRFEGRPASPALALPSAASTKKSSFSATAPASAAAGIQNVGAIALPGSQLDSEFPIHPLALSLNHGLVPRPPALPQKQLEAIAASTNAAGPSRSSTTAPPTSRGSGSSGKTKTSRPSQPRFQSEPVTEPTLQFTLPDPSAPPPVHFLRNQENLLGKAGRVGGITTAAPLPQPRGSTPSNPIMIDDDEDTPMIGRRNGSKSRDSSQKPVDPINLAQPTNEEIVSVLVGQKDIFPVLESILKLIENGAQPKLSLPPRLTGFERRPPGSQAHEWSMAPPAKKRKLNRVPAGATDWDVPFPFPDGEGPTAYQQNWERDRSKRLVTELIKLIKVAARKAAAKKYFGQQKSQQSDSDMDADTFKGYYRPETALYGLQSSQLESGVMSMGGNPRLEGAVPSMAGQTPSSMPSTVLPSVSSSQEEMWGPLDQLLSSFMASPVENADFLSIPAVCRPPTDSVPSTTSKNAFDTWMNLFETFPDSPTGGAQTSSTDDFGSAPISPDLESIFKSIMETPAPITAPSSTPINNPDYQGRFSPSLFDFSSMTPNLPSTSAQDLPSSHSFGLIDFASEPIPAIGEPLDAWFPMPSRTESSPFMNSTAGIVEDPTRPSSPLPSVSSESQAVTPASASWDFSLPDIFSGGNDDVEGQGNLPKDVDLGRTGFGEKELNLDLSGLQTRLIDKGKAKEVDPSTTTNVLQAGPIIQSAFNALLSKTRRDELLASAASSSIRPSTSATTNMSKQGNETQNGRQRRKEDIIRRAKERRQEIQEDLHNIKRQLWETTIEQAGLIHLTKKLEVEGEMPNEAP